uniref:Radical SAM core domain-containing protein n=1 Tax=Craspedostauros australis TaxID=1486917 RepID=A0A6T6FKK2_9STRA|mmetsp:Transcript_19953/g.55496  ORF Transcript_19953/g.55496 Transcript_19953/m.55496 type:complete len:294 (+) Transcript_19953:229-1110(+)
MRVSAPRCTLTASLTYTLGKDLYIPLTSRCNTRTLPETRGPNFALPPHVVSSLCTVRDLETQTQQWKYWCLWLDTQDDTTRHKLPQRNAMTQAARLPTVQQLLDDVEQQVGSSGAAGFQSFVIAGEGEPTLRMGELLELTQSLRATYTDVPIRLTTNGLLSRQSGSINIGSDIGDDNNDGDNNDGDSGDNDEEDMNATVPQQLHDAGVSQVSVALMTSDADQYNELMEPNCQRGAEDPLPHSRVCDFISQCLVHGIEVETTGVDRPDVKKPPAEELAKSLSVVKPFRWRPFFP